MKVSVIVPTFCRPALLREALASLVLQQGPAFEVLVLNDGGRALADAVLPSTLTGQVVNLPHGGQSTALNVGLGRARGEYITVAQDDDLTLPGKLQVLADAMDADPEAVAVYSLPQYTDENGAALPCPPRLRAYLRDHPVVRWADVERRGLFIHGTATMYRRTALEAIGGWDPELRTAEEYDLHLRLLHAGGVFRAVDAVTVTYRRWPGGKSQDRFRRRRLRAGVMATIYARVGLTDPVPQEAQGD